MNKIKNLFKNIDKLDLKIMKKGLKCCFTISLFAVILLIYYLTFNNLFLYNLGLALFKASTYFGIEFIVCGVVVDSIKNELFNRF